MRRLVLLLLLAFATTPALLTAQDPNVAPTSAEAGSAAEISAEPTQTSGGTDLSEVEMLPRATRPYWHVFIAFAIAWGLLFGYAITLGRRFAALETQVKQLRGS